MNNQELRIALAIITRASLEDAARRLEVDPEAITTLQPKGRLTVKSALKRIWSARPCSIA